MHFFSDIPVFVLAERGDGNKLEIAASETAAGPAVSCFLSPLHALIDAMYWAGRGKPYEVRHAALIAPETFINTDGTALVAQLRVGWPALDGKIVLESNGNTATCAKLMVHSTAHGPPPFFELDPETLGQVEGMHERAGMYAWREIYGDMLEWDKGRLEWAVRRALETMKISTVDKSVCTKAALFDPEFGQWHFVPFDNL
ncbi:hypothetical protein LMG28614_03201 [Paraburkholderia ultramafica]|uniref:Uncharacterized protein n=1 Tax=Paraburkholderia ultramafica TaxID=1544867 RepID=A0A6S7B9Y5_9BURK|nr:hypothetical protein [Paraburkholderia ultramafica]CAB3790944.1 hypothetical protein LMG28614_03201 [Paraburkholderia ultramafica]